MAINTLRCELNGKPHSFMYGHTCIRLTQEAGNFGPPASFVFLSTPLFIQLYARKRTCSESVCHNSRCGATAFSALRCQRAAHSLVLVNPSGWTM